MGFSAGAHLSALWPVQTTVSVPIRKSILTTEVSLRPDFTILVYPAYLAGENFSIAHLNSR